MRLADQIVPSAVPEAMRSERLGGGSGGEAAHRKGLSAVGWARRERKQRTSSGRSVTVAPARACRAMSSARICF